MIINGEYINGVLKEKEYYNVGNLKFEGEYSNGYIWNGIWYDKNNNYVSEINNGNGYIKLYNEDKL